MAYGVFARTTGGLQGDADQGLAAGAGWTWLYALTSCPWPSHAGVHAKTAAPTQSTARRPLYSPEERRRRDATPWTFVQGVLAPLQFAVFLVSLVLVLRFLSTGEGEAAAAGSVVIKTALLYTIMLTGCVWEKVVFGKWLFAPAFFWEDVFSLLVLALHTAYLFAYFQGVGTAAEQFSLALGAYAAYAVNATQFVLKLRAARVEGASTSGLAAVT